MANAKETTTLGRDSPAIAPAFPTKAKAYTGCTRKKTASAEP